MKAFDELTQRGRIDRLSALGKGALATFGVRPRAVTHIARSENVTFDVRAGKTGRGKGPGGPYVPGRYLLRLHRPGYHTLEGVRSELTWLSALRDLDIPVPDPVRAKDGSTAVLVEREGVPGGRVCTLLRWMEGKARRAETSSPGHLRMVGRLMAGLHSHSASWRRPRRFVRGRWDWYGLFETAGTAGTDDSWVWDALPVRIRRLYEPSARETANAIEDLGEEPDVFGLIHADLHMGNVLFGGGEARAIDFDDCGDGHWLYDIAVALFDHVENADWERFRDAFLEGYATVREPPRFTDEHLATFMCARCVSLMLWTHVRARENPAFKKSLKTWTDWSVRFLKEHCPQ